MRTLPNGPEDKITSVWLSVTRRSVTPGGCIGDQHEKPLLRILTRFQLSNVVSRFVLFYSSLFCDTSFSRSICVLMKYELIHGISFCSVPLSPMVLCSVPSRFNCLFWLLPWTLQEYSNWPTIPQLYIDGEFTGGADIMVESFQSGELKKTLEEKGCKFLSA